VASGNFSCPTADIRYGMGPITLTHAPADSEREMKVRRVNLVCMVALTPV